MCSQVIKIQAAFQGFQALKQDWKANDLLVQLKKIIQNLRSLGVLEKAILRWRLKRKGFKGFHVNKGVEPAPGQGDTEEDFYITSRKQAEERINAQVQAMFLSRRAHEEYERMKLTHNQAALEYEDFLNPDADMVTSSSAGSTKRV